MPLYRHRGNSKIARNSKINTSTISPDIFTSTQKSANGDTSQTVKFKLPTVSGFNKQSLGYLSDSPIDEVIAADTTLDSNQSPRESASFERGGIDKNDDEFYGELNDKVQADDENAEKEKTWKKPTAKPVQTKATDKKERKKKENADLKRLVNKKKVESKSIVEKKKNIFDKKNFISKKKRGIRNVEEMESPELPIKKKIDKSVKERNEIEDFLDSSIGSITSSAAVQAAFHDLMESESQEYVREPPVGATKLERLQWMQSQRDVGLYVHCDSPGCDKLRHLPHVKDPLDLPDKWYCHMNPDPEYNRCDIAEKIINIYELDDMIDALYNAGSIVWGCVPGYPWWPAMVDDDPDYEAYYWLDKGDIPTWYNVTFFDDKQVTRAWLKPNQIRPFKDIHLVTTAPLQRLYGKRLAIAKKQALEACGMELIERLKKFSFISRYPSILHKLTKDNNTSANTNEEEEEEQ